MLIEQAVVVLNLCKITEPRKLKVEMLHDLIEF